MPKRMTRPRHARRFGQRLVGAGQFPPRAVYELAGGKDYEGDRIHWAVAKAICAMAEGLAAMERVPTIRRFQPVRPLVMSPEQCARYLRVAKDVG